MRFKTIKIGIDATENFDWLQTKHIIKELPGVFSVWLEKEYCWKMKDHKRRITKEKREGE